MLCFPVDAWTTAAVVQIGVPSTYRTFLIFCPIVKLTYRIGRRYFYWKVEGDKL